MRAQKLAAVGAACAFTVLLSILVLESNTAFAAERPVSAIASERDVLVADSHLQAAARRGNARAQAMLGYAYATGLGVPQNFVVAAMWYRRAAGQGNATAQYLLGMMYDHGQGVPLDKVLAQKWLILATAGANDRQRDDFRRIRDAVASSMSPNEIAQAQAFADGWSLRHRRRSTQ